MVDFQNDIKNCIKVLKHEGLILYPTDTIWGIGCDATNDIAIEKIYSLKKRPESKAMIILVADLDHLKKITDPSEDIVEYISNALMPTTVIYDHAKNISPRLLAEDGSIAIRIVKDEFCKQLITRLNKPLVSTSANISGSPAPVAFNYIDDEIKNGVDYIVQHHQDEIISAYPSAIIKYSDGKIITIR